MTLARAFVGRDAELTHLQEAWTTAGDSALISSVNLAAAQRRFLSGRH
jgi:hypothetical protein